MNSVKEYENYINLQLFKSLLRDVIQSFSTPANYEYYRKSEVDDWLNDLKIIIDVFHSSGETANE